jgi:hypothetical protein
LHTIEQHCKSNDSWLVIPRRHDHFRAGSRLILYCPKPFFKLDEFAVFHLPLEPYLFNENL